MPDTPRVAADPRPDAPINLPGRLLDAWRRTVLDLARLPRGTRRSELEPEELLGMVLRQETGGIIDLWEAFTKEREELSRGLLGTQQHTVAYLLGFHLVNAARTSLLLRRLSERWDLRGYLRRLGAEARVTWYDFGCGTGAVAHAGADYLLAAGVPPSALGFHLYDTSSGLLTSAARVLAHAGCTAPVRSHRLGLERLDPALIPRAHADSGFHALSLGYVWNEIAKNGAAKARILRLLRDQVAGSTLVLVLEPASQTFARAAMALRDELVGAGYQPLYPCPSPLPCPMLTLSRDWCYSEGTWQRPKIMQTLDKSLGISRDHLSGTLLAFASPALAARLSPLTAGQGVVVGRPERLQPKVASLSRPARPRSPGFDYLICENGTLSKAPAAPEAPHLPRGTTLTP